VDVGQPKSEARGLTEVVTVRFSQADLQEVIEAAEEIGVSVPRLLRETGLEAVRGRRGSADVS
jgi:hypothetical protein